MPVEKRGNQFYNHCMFPMRLIPAVLIFSLLLGCVQTPFTQRPSEDRMPVAQEIALGEEAYREIIKREKISQDPQLIEMVERVGRQLAAVSAMPNLSWEFTLIESNPKNIFVLPGGKVIIYTGILPVCANEAGLAAVMSHQIAHTTAGHGVNRLSPHIAKEGTATPAGLSHSRDKNDILAALGAHTAEEFVWPYDPRHESAADEIGMNLMAKAGYDPMEAERLWDRFNKMKKGSRVPEILSTHPIDLTRLGAIRRLLPKANRVYRMNPLKHGLGRSFLYILSRRKMQKKPVLPTPPSGIAVPGTGLKDRNP